MQAALHGGVGDQLERGAAERQRAGRAGATGVGVSAAGAPPAAAIDEPANTNGSSRRASCQTGTEVWAISTAV